MIFRNFYFNYITLIMFFALLNGCSVTPVLPTTASLPRQYSQPPLVLADRPAVAFVLGSGSARGFAHVGVLKVLEDNGIKADFVVGSSAGSVVGALYAGGIRNHALTEAAQQLDIGQLTDWTFPDRGVVKGERLQLYVNQLLQNRPIEALPTKFVVVVTDLESGERVVFNHGDTGMAVRASSSIPGLVQPVTIGERQYVDGGLVSQVPVRVARQLGADVVIAVDVSRILLPVEQLDTTFAVMQQAFTIMTHKIAEEEASEADVVIRPNLEGIGVDGFDLRDQAVAAGEAAALAAISDIKRAIEKKTRIRTRSSAEN